MFSPMFAPNTPEWLFITIVVLCLCLIFGLFGWAIVLEYRYSSPNTLIRTSNRDKWSKAAILALLQTSMIPIIGFAAPFLSPLSNQWSFIPTCVGIWIVALPIATIYKRWEFERYIKSYQNFDKMIKDRNSFYHHRYFQFSISLMKMFVPAEHKRFFNEGFPDEVDEKKDGETSVQESKSDLHN